MTLLLLEALGAGLILIGIIWWTMFAGRKNGELPQVHTGPDAVTPPAQAPAEPASAHEAQDKNPF